MPGEVRQPVPGTANETPDLKKILDTADKNEAVRELQRQLDSEVRFAGAKELLKDQGLRARMKAFINDPALREKIPEPLKTNLNRIIDEIEGVVTARTDFRAEMTAQGIVPPGQPQTAPNAAPGQVPTATPPGTAPTPGAQPNPNTPATTPAGAASGKPPGKERSLADLSIQEIFKGLVDNLGGLFSTLGQVFAGATTSPAAKEEKPAETTPSAPKFTEEQLKAIKLALEKNKDTQYPGQEKATEYICDVLNLPRVDSPQKLLDYLKNSEINGQKLVFNQEITNLKKLKSGDVLFFRKDVNQAQPFLCAVVSKVTVEQGQEPRIFVKTIGAGGGAPQEMELIGDLRSQYYGAIQIPQNLPAQDVAPPPVTPPAQAQSPGTPEQPAKQ